VKARQFFDVWATCLKGVATARAYPSMANGQRALAVSEIAERHGAEVGEKAGLLFDSLREGARTALK